LPKKLVLTSPVTSSDVCVLQDAVHVFSGGLDNTLKQFNFNTNNGKTVFLFPQHIDC